MWYSSPRPHLVGIPVVPSVGCDPDSATSRPRWVDGDSTDMDNESTRESYSTSNQGRTCTAHQFAEMTIDWFFRRATWCFILYSTNRLKIMIKEGSLLLEYSAVMGKCATLHGYIYSLNWECCVLPPTCMARVLGLADNNWSHWALGWWCLPARYVPKETDRLPLQWRRCARPLRVPLKLVTIPGPTR